MVRAESLVGSDQTCSVVEWSFPNPIPSLSHFAFCPLSPNCTNKSKNAKNKSYLIFHRHDCKFLITFQSKITPTAMWQMPYLKKTICSTYLHDHSNPVPVYMSGKEHV